MLDSKQLAGLCYFCSLWLPFVHGFVDYSKFVNPLIGGAGPYSDLAC